MGTDITAELPEVLTVAEIAEVLRCSQSSVRDLIRLGALRHFKIGPVAGYRVTAAALAEFIAGRTS